MQYTAIVVSLAVLIIVMFAFGNILRRIRKLQKTNVIVELQSEVSELILELNQTTSIFTDSILPTTFRQRKS